MFNKVFIAHAHEDIEPATKLYYYLHTNSPFEPWLDKENLLPGQDWQVEINRQIRLADFIVIFFSKTAVTKTGHIQKEFKLALDYCEQRPEDAIYLIPILLDDCEPPEKFKKYHWVRYDDIDSNNEIYRALRKQRDIYLNRELIKISQNLSYEFREHSLDEVWGDKVFHKINISYPQFVKTTIKSLVHLNAYILAEVYKTYNAFLRISPLDEVNGNPYKPGNECVITYNFELITPDFVSLSVYHYSYTGGAHGNYATEGINYRLQPLTEITLEEILDYQDEHLHRFAQLCKSKLLKKAESVFEIKDENEFFLLPFDEQISWAFLSNIYVRENTITVIFNPYHITAYAYGQHEIILTFHEIEEACGSIHGLKDLAGLINNSKT